MRMGVRRGSGRGGCARGSGRPVAPPLASVLAPVLGLAPALALAGPGTVAAQVADPVTPAGTIITNTAEVGWTIAGERAAARSNPDRLIVAERLDVRLLPVAGAPAVDLVNAGSGEEAFALAAATAETAAGDPGRAPPILVDANRDGRCDPAIDRPLAGDRTPPLAAGATLRLLVCDAAGTVRLAARAATGSGVPGTGFSGLGDGGGDAVVGPTGAAAAVTLGTAAAPQPVLVKSQTVAAPDGTARAVTGAAVTYTLAARFAAAARAAEIEDPLPPGTRVVPGSLRLDAAPLSDAADADAGEVAAGAVRVRLGDVPAGGEHIVTFTVIITA